MVVSDVLLFILLVPDLILFVRCWQQDTQLSYREARQVRCLQGHDSAVPFYKEILAQNRNDMTAATRIAASELSPERHDQLGRRGTLHQRRRFIGLLEDLNFNANNIADLVFHNNENMVLRAKASSAPLYLQPLRAGTECPTSPNCPLNACIQLFLLAVCVPYETCKNLLGNEFVQLMEELGICFRDNYMIVPYCHIMPITVAEKTIYVATDLHPNVLSTTTVGRKVHDNDNGVVMYIGPDSLGLIDHWCALQQPIDGDTILDIGCGSGIQALCLAAKSQAALVEVKCIDINARALRLTKVNFDWNSLPEATLILGDINNPNGRVYCTHAEKTEKPQAWEHLLGHPKYIVSNPPFLPVPVNFDVSKRYGWYSDGGGGGETFLQSLIGLASKILYLENSTLAIVSEFMNPDHDFERRLSDWWDNVDPFDALLFTNEYALNATDYAHRRADNEKEAMIWENHLHSEGIDYISPGFLYLKRRFQNNKNNDVTIVDPNNAVFHHHLVPKTSDGSIWTPSNIYARKFTRQIFDDTFL